MSKLTSPIKWAGGKSWLVEIIKDYYNPNKRLVELFSGSCGVSIGLKPKTALLNDINRSLITFYNTIKNGLIVNIEFKNEREIYYLYRHRFNLLKSKALLTDLEVNELSQLFYYLNRTCFNGLYRENSKGEFNVPFGKYKNINYKTDFNEYVDLFKNWKFISNDFENLDIIEYQDFLYCDPPYDCEFTKYSKSDFKWEDQIRLIKWLEQYRCPIVISNQATDRIIELYKSFGYELKFVNAPRRISCTGDRRPKLEVLATKNLFFNFQL